MKPREVQHVLALREHLKRHDEWLEKSQTQYDHYVGEEIQELEFQTKLVEHALNSTGTWNAELATGIGKTIIAARIALKKVHKGPILYICASPTAIGDAETGIINKFIRVFETFGHKTAALGERNELSRANDVSFMTPGSFVRQYNKNPDYVERLLSRVSCFIVDEAHHFPQDEDKELKVYGKIYDLAKQHVAHGLILSMTGTWERLDRKIVMGSIEPDVRMTVQNAVDLGRCPEIYAIQVILDIVAKESRAVGDLYDYHLQGDDRTDYFDSIAECIATVYQKYTVAFAAFARTQQDAREIAKRFNDMLELGAQNGLAVLTSRTPMKARQQAIKDIEAGIRVGYITCAVGEEALDLPPLEVIHLIRRTRSVVRNIQAIGRALRLYKEKKRALIVDYQMMVQGMVGRFVGLNVDDLLESVQSKVPYATNGGPLVVQREIKEAELRSVSMDSERALVIRRNMTPEQLQIIEDRKVEERKSYEYHAEQEKQRAEHKKRFEVLARGFKSVFGSYYGDMDQRDIFSFMNVYPEHAFPDAGIFMCWWPTHKMDEVMEKECKEMERSNTWREWAEVRSMSYNYTKGEVHTLMMLWHCFLMSRPDNEACRAYREARSDLLVDKHLRDSEHWKTDIPIAVIVGAILVCFRDGYYLNHVFDELKDIKWDGSFRTEVWNDFIRDQVPRTILLDVKKAVTEMFNIADFEDWHHTQKNVLPVSLDVDMIKHFKIRNVEDFGVMAGHIWMSIRTRMQLIAILAQRGPRLMREPEPVEVRTASKRELTKKQVLLHRAEKDDFPTFKNEKKLYQMLLLYIRPGSKVYDSGFVEALRGINPSWLARSKKCYDEDGNPKLMGGAE